MDSKPVRMVNVVPITRLKKTPLPEDNEDSVACLICSKTFASESALTNHGRNEHIDAMLNGQNLCVKNYKAATTSKVETKDRSPSDGERKAKRAKRDTVRVKVTSKKEAQAVTGPFECLQPSTAAPDSPCHQMFFSCCEYSSHLRDEHTRRRKGIKCQVCEKPLSAYGSEPQPNTCQVCGVSFERAAELSVHACAQRKAKPFQCSLCRKRFTQQGGLAQHMRAHRGDRPFGCSYCAKTFTQKSGLEQHLRIHTKLKPYKCVVCGKAFCQSVHLQQHMRTHTNVMPFHCLICHKRFKQSSHLNYHLKYHTATNMTDDQKLKYSELMRAMGKESTADRTSDGDGGGRLCHEQAAPEELVVDGQGGLDGLGSVVEVVYME